MIEPRVDVVLASTSNYRAQLLRRVVAGFRIAPNQVDESAQADERPRDTAIRLASLKARTVAGSFPGCLVIGCDQLADLDGRPLGKPGTTEAAVAQLAQCSGRIVDFHTAICLADSRNGTLKLNEACDLTRVHMRNLGEAEIRRYVADDQPFDCAGSFKVEQRGIALFERVESSDPSALIGLPLIALCHLLRAAGLALP
jgi:septum formation protein